jgi:hypothetical protein
MRKKEYIVPVAVIVRMERIMLNDQMSFQLGGEGRNDEDSWSKQEVGHDLWGDLPDVPEEED